MRKLLIVIILLSNFLIAVGCEKIPNQSNISHSPTVVKIDSNSIIQENSQIQVGTKANEKYKLTALFYRTKAANLPETDGKEKLFDTLVIRNDATNQRVKPIEMVTNFSNQTQDVWSPDNEFLLLPGNICGQNGFCIYKTSEIVQMFEKNLDFQHKQPSDFVSVTFTEFRPPQTAKKKDCSYTFENWMGENSFIFKVRAFESKDGFGEFEYDISKLKIFDNLIKPSITNGGFEAINKTGKLEFTAK